MAEVGNIIFSYKEVVTALLKAQDIHEGFWALFVRFGLNAANVGPNENEIRPTAILTIAEIGLQKAEKESNIAVDAAKMNPKPDSPSRQATKTHSRH
jgi:hypothetical protein